MEQKWWKHALLLQSVILVIGSMNIKFVLLLFNISLFKTYHYQLQLSDSITIIGAEDFPENWPNLINGMVEKMKTKNFHVINGVLQTAHSLFKRSASLF